MLIFACVVGDGAAVTGPLASEWHSNKSLSALTDGVAPPIMRLDGYRISTWTILARIGHGELEQLLQGYSGTPLLGRRSPVGQDNKNTPRPGRLSCTTTNRASYS